MEDVLGLTSYLHVILRRKWHFLVAFLTVVSLSFIFTFTLPKIYKSQASIMIEKRGGGVVKGIFEPAHINSAKFATMTAVIKSQSKIDKLIKKLSLDKNLKGPLEYESLVGKIRRNLWLGMRGTNLLAISYSGREPRTCMQIVNSVSNFFIEQDIGAMYGRHYASPMLKKMLDYYEKRVNKARGALTKFKIENKGQMPGSLDKNFAQLEASQIRLAAKELAIKETSAKKEEIEKHLLGETKEPLSALEQETLTPEEQKLKKINQQLENMLTTYTEKHPVVIKLKNQIEIQKKKVLESYLQNRVTQDAEDAANLQNPLLSPRRLKLRKLLKQTKTDLASLQKEQENLKEQILNYDEKVKNAPLKEQEYAALQRELKVNQNIYNSLLSKLEDSRLAKEIDLMGQDIRFTVIEPAQLPLSPISPKMSKNLVVGTILGLFLGICSAFWAEYVDHSLRDPKELQNLVQVPLLATIPTVYTEGETIKHKRMTVISFVAGGAYLTFLLLLIARELIMTYTPSLLYLQTYKIVFKRFWQALGLGVAGLIFMSRTKHEQD